MNRDFPVMRAAIETSCAEFEPAEPEVGPSAATTQSGANTLLSSDAREMFARHIRDGAKPRAGWRCGLEYELLGYNAATLSRLAPGEVSTVLSQLAASPDAVIYESGTATESRTARGERLTVEPGGQIEFSGAPHVSLDCTEAALRVFLTDLRQVANENGFVFLAAGFDPLRTPSEQHWYPKARYGVMRPFLRRRGARAEDMMARTCAMQVNVDYSAEVEDLAKKYLLGNRLAPIITAIFANSPFASGAPSGYKSTRAAAWLETDPARAGVAPLALDGEFTVEKLVDDVLRIPMVFVRRDGEYRAVSDGLTFEEFLQRGDSLQPVFHDWTDHLTTVFTEARVKQYIELRSADCSSPEMAMALQALWKGLLYDSEALDEALRLAPRPGAEQMRFLELEVARDALAARAEGTSVLGLAKEIILLAVQGLGRIAPDEVAYLDVLREQVIDDEVCPADILLRNWNGRWSGSMKPVFDWLRVA